MNKEEIRVMLGSMGIRRHQIFISLSHKDEALAKAFVNRFVATKINVWSMYDSAGGDTNISGERYKSVIKKNIDACCVFVYLFSKDSIRSPEVKDELRQVSEAININHEKIKVIPVSLDSTTYADLPEDINAMGILTQDLIYRQIGSGTDEAIAIAVSEIVTQYYDAIFEQIRDANNAAGQSYLFTDLLRKCLHKRCTAGTISQDIVSSDEGRKESLLEAHILTDEIIEYDNHPYTCMLISSNLLGNYDNAIQNFDPEHRGVKYFYYCPEAYLEEVRDAFQKKIRDFIVKGRASRGEVVLLIRREFAERNKLMYFIDSFNDTTVHDLMDRFCVRDEEDVKEFQKELQKDENTVFFVYTATSDELLEVPEEFYIWMSDDHSQLYNDHIRHEAYRFVDFLGRLADLVERISSKDSAGADRARNMVKYYRYLKRLVLLEQWQLQDPGVSISPVEEKKLYNHLIGFTEGANMACKDFPNLANWLRLTFDADGRVKNIDQEVAEKAAANLIFIPVKPDSVVKPCYSFVVYLNKDTTHALWYSTGYEDDSRNMVIGCEANPETSEYKEYVAAFKGLIKFDPSIQKILQEHDSRILKKKEEKSN